MKKSYVTKLFTIILAGVLCLSFAACNKRPRPGKDPADSEGGTPAGGSSAGSPAEDTTAPETMSDEEIQAMNDQLYLDTVTYLNFELTGEDRPYFVGRWFEKTVDGASHMVTTTDGAHLYLLVVGATEVLVNFTTVTRLELPYFSYSIDGAEPVRQHIDEPSIHLPDASYHTLRIIADGMTEHEAKWIRENGFALRSVEVENGRIAGIKPTDRVVFFYGDSITEGVRALSMESNANGNSATRAYSWYTAQNLGAVPYTIGYGASGLIQVGSFRPMPEAIDHLSRDRLVDDSPTAAVKPDLIVINHGANDAGVPQKDFDEALRTAIARLQEKYPGVTIVYCVAFLEAEHAGVIKQGECIDALASEIDGLYVVHTKDWDLTYTDGNLHPDAEGGAKAGRLLAKAIREIVGADFFS